MTAACCVQAPMKLAEIHKYVKDAGNGLYNRYFGKNLKQLLKINEPYLRDYYKEEHDIELAKTLEEMPDCGCMCNELFIAKMFGFKDELDYYQ